MKRRDFLMATVAASSLGSMTGVLGAADTDKNDSSPREFYELRKYWIRNGPKRALMDHFLRDAALPAFRRHGVGPVGVFQVQVGSESPSHYLLLPYPSIDLLATLEDRLAEDDEYQKKGAAFLDLPATDPGYVRMESALMRAFPGMPKLEVPAATAAHKPRLFELRTYENHSKKANRTKIQMFDRGEIKIFRHNGLQPVFFGETLIGSRLPHLTYMLVFDSMEARNHHWGAFGSDPEWRKLSRTPGYTDPEIVANISNCFLRPTSYSQI